MIPQITVVLAAGRRPPEKARIGADKNSLHV